MVRLQVRAEHVEVRKQIVVYERVLVRRRELDSTARVEARVSREELRVELDGETSVSAPPS
jgi:uncharacterized protein (TIGR02271 family)